MLCVLMREEKDGSVMEVRMKAGVESRSAVTWAGKCNRFSQLQGPTRFMMSMHTCASVHHVVWRGRDERRKKEDMGCNSSEGGEYERAEAADSRKRAEGTGRKDLGRRRRMKQRG
eukprot:591245-Rhodomonas_salina.1